MRDRVSNRATVRGGRRNTRHAVDALIVNRDDVWILVGHDADDTVDLLRGGQTDGRLRICRAILDGDLLVIGDADPERDHLLSELLCGKRCGHA